MPGGKIAFVTDEMYTAMGTRADEYEHARAVMQLATISVAGGDADRRLFPQNLSHCISPFLRSDGKIGFSRWEHLGSTNDVKLFAANLDGTQILAVAGQHGKPANSLFSVRETTPNVMVGIATNRDLTIHAGALIQIDARNHSVPACLDATANQAGLPCLDEEHATFQVLTPDVPLDDSPSPVGRFREPSLLPDGRIVTSFADGFVNGLNEQSATPPDFGIYVYDPSTQKSQLIFNDKKYWDLNALAIAPHNEPAVVADQQAFQDSSVASTIGSVKLSDTSLVETVTGAQFNATPLDQALQSATKVRIVEGFSSESCPGVTKFGLTMDEGAAVLGEATVRADESWLAQIPPYVPVHLQPVDKFDMAIRNQRLWMQNNAGEQRRCPGCHESRTAPGLPASGGPVSTLADQAGPENFNLPVATRVKTEEYGWDAIQPILSAKCASCHNAATSDYYQITNVDPSSGLQTTYNVPTLDLTTDPVSVFYDETTNSWPASYVSLYYPATTMMMGPDRATITGKIPPMWMIPESARSSLLLQKVNVQAPDGTWAWDPASNPPHPADVGAPALTQAEVQALIRNADLGGQYFSRENTGFVPFMTGDPVAPAVNGVAQ